MQIAAASPGTKGEIADTAKKFTYPIWRPSGVESKGYTAANLLNCCIARWDNNEALSLTAIYKRRTEPTNAWGIPGKENIKIHSFPDIREVYNQERRL